MISILSTTKVYVSKATLREFSDAVVSQQKLPPGFKIVLAPRKKGDRLVRDDSDVNVPVPTKKSFPLLDDDRHKVGDLIAAVTGLLEEGLILSSKVKLANGKVIYPAHKSLKRIRAEEPSITVKKSGDIDTQKLAKEFKSFVVAAERAIKPKELAAQAVLETCMEVLLAHYSRKTVAAALARV